MTSVLPRVLLTFLAASLGACAGWIDEHVFLLGAMPFAMGIVCRGLLGRMATTLPHRLIPFLCFVVLVSMWVGRYKGAESLYHQSHEAMVGGIADPGGDPFQLFLRDEVGQEGLLGFIELRSITGIRVFANRGLDWGPWGFGLQFLFEAGVLLSGSGMTLRRDERHLHTEEFEDQTE